MVSIPRISSFPKKEEPLLYVRADWRVDYVKNLLFDFIGIKFFFKQTIFIRYCKVISKFVSMIISHLKTKLFINQLCQGKQLFPSLTKAKGVNS